MERKRARCKIGFSLSSLAECDIEYISPSEYQSSSKDEDGNDASKKSSLTSNGYEDPYEKLVRGNLDRLDKEKVSKWINSLVKIPPKI